MMRDREQNRATRCIYLHSVLQQQMRIFPQSPPMRSFLAAVHGGSPEVLYMYVDPRFPHPTSMRSETDQDQAFRDS